MTDSDGEPAFPTPPPPPPPNVGPPPGYASYGGTAQGDYASFQRVGGVGRTLGILLTILIPLQILMVFFRVIVTGKAQDFIDGTISKDDLDKALAPYTGLSLVSSALTLAIVVLTMIWMFRMAKNQRALGRDGTWGPGWAIGSWFVPPCVLYVVPYLMFRDLWKSSDPQSGPDWRTNPIAPIVHIWWVLYGLVPIAFVTVTFGRFRVSTDRSDRQIAQDLVDSAGLDVAAGIVSIGAAVAFLLLVRQLTARHKQTINEL